MKQGLVTSTDVTRFWYKDDLPHREDGPAIEWADGTKYWMINGLPHREGGPAFISTKGLQEWYLNGRYHRVDGPAVWEFNPNNGVTISTEWYLYGNRHRLDGPACEWNWGVTLYYINGEEITCKNNEEFLRIVKLKVFL